MPAEAPHPTPEPTATRLLIVNSTLHIGGAEQVAADLAENMGGEFDVTACYLKEAGHIAEHMRVRGVRLMSLPGLVPGRRDYLTFLKLRRLVTQRRIEVIHTHDLHGMFDGAACRLTTPGLRWVHTFHFGNYPHRKFRNAMVERVLWRVADALVAVSHRQADMISATYGIPRKRLNVVWNGVREPEPAAATLVPGPPLPDGVPVIASISTMIAQKGIEHLLAAARELRDAGERFVLLIAGGGPLFEAHVQRAQALRLTDCVRFLGWIPQASSLLLPRCDIFVQSSLWEAMSIVVLEAMAAGKAMVVTAVGENPRVVLEGETGLMVPPADSHALAAALRGVMHDPALRARLGAAARRRYEREFTVARMVAEYERLYAGLLAQRP